MKLKFLMMPTTVIISIIIIIWYIWPAWFDKDLKYSVASVRKDIKMEQSEINKIKQRKSNIISLNDSLQSQNENKELIFNYYPITHKEENIINKINHIAFSSGVYIADLKVDYGKNSAKEELNEILAIPKNSSNIQAAKSALTTQSSIVKESTLQVATPKLISLELEIYGNYDQIKNFLNMLYPIGLLNNIQLFKIAKSDGKQENAEGSEDEKSSMLTSNITISFGYLMKKNNTISNLLEASLFETNSFDFSVIDEYRNMALEKYPNSEVGETGELNPFFP